MGDHRHTKTYDRIANTIVGVISGIMLWVVYWWLIEEHVLAALAVFLVGGAFAGLLLGRHFFSVVESIVEAAFGD